MSFAEYARREKQKEPAARKAVEAYWLKRFATVPPPLELPSDRPRPTTKSFRGASLCRYLDAGLYQAVKETSARQRCTAFVSLFAAFQVLLGRLASQDEVVVGIPTAGQSLLDGETLVGHCVNFLPIRGAWSGDTTVASHLAAVADSVIEAHEHQDYTFGTLVRKMALKRSPNRLPLTEVQFNLDGLPNRFTLPGLSGKMELNPKAYVNFDLFFNFIASEEGLRIDCDYSTDLFDEATVNRWIDCYASILEAFTEDLAAPISGVAFALPLAAPSGAPSLQSTEARSNIQDGHSQPIPAITEEQLRQLAEWNATDAAYPLDQCVHELFEAQVLRTPEAPAVIYDDSQLTYAELNAAANRLAHHLRGLGVKPDALVAVCMERSLELVISLLAILKAGGAYVPLDPAYPPERLTYMLQDSAPAALLTGGKARDVIAGHTSDLPVLDLERDAALWGNQSKANPDRPSSPAKSRRLAYVIYTSGSTGTPKGAMNEHRGVVNRLLWMQDAYKLGAGDAVLQKTPFSFDVSVWEFFWPLMTGARLVMARPEGHKDPDYLARIIERRQITTLHFVPSMLQVFLNYGDAARCSSLVRVICSGEALPASFVRQFHERFPGVELHNLYGPTEAAVDVTAWPCLPDSNYTRIPIGRPIANTRIYILDKQRNLLPPGQSGEIFIGGVQVGRGYLNRPELTAERFLSDPFSGDPAARMYRTGDLGRWLADGSIEYLGRSDFQVKLRGFRIELEEVESALTGLSGVLDACVGVEGEDDMASLIGFIATSPGDGRTPAEWRDLIRQTGRLPEYMIPNRIVCVDFIPLTVNGKKDRKKLLELYGARPEDRPVFDAAAASGDLTGAIRRLWIAVLGHGNFTNNDNFFDAGGTSLRAVRLFALMTNSGIADPGRHTVITLFESATVAKLAEKLAHDREGGGAAKPGASQANRLVQRNAALARVRDIRNRGGHH
jgi:arthrofactin-type cyclic lipopeptide synthetase C